MRYDEVHNEHTLTHRQVFSVGCVMSDGVKLGLCWDADEKCLFENSDMEFVTSCLSMLMVTTTTTMMMMMKMSANTLHTDSYLSASFVTWLHSALSVSSSAEAERLGTISPGGP